MHRHQEPTSSEREPSAGEQAWSLMLTRSRSPGASGQGALFKARVRSVPGAESSQRRPGASGQGGCIHAKLRVASSHNTQGEIRQHHPAGATADANETRISRRQNRQRPGASSHHDVLFTAQDDPQDFWPIRGAIPATRSKQVVQQ
jgi:hypothetical protein